MAFHVQARNHSASPWGDALGGRLGGLVIAAAEGYTAPSLVGAGLSVLRLAALRAGAVVGRRERASGGCLRRLARLRRGLVTTYFMP
jgi:hypothetical protein